MIQNLHEFMDAQSLSSAYLVGHNMGRKTHSTTHTRADGFAPPHERHADGISHAICDIIKRRAASFWGGS